MHTLPFSARPSTPRPRSLLRLEPTRVRPGHRHAQRMQGKANWCIGMTRHAQCIYGLHWARRRGYHLRAFLRPVSSAIYSRYVVAKPVKCRYISNIEMPGGTIRYVPLHPPKDGATRTSPASEWKIDFDELEKTINSKTKMIVSLWDLNIHWSYIY